MGPFNTSKMDYDNLPQYLNKELKAELDSLTSICDRYVEVASEPTLSRPNDLKEAIATCAFQYNAIEEELVRREAKFYWWTHNTIG